MENEPNYVPHLRAIEERCARKNRNARVNVMHYPIKISQNWLLDNQVFCDDNKMLDCIESIENDLNNVHCDKDIELETENVLEKTNIKRPGHRCCVMS